MINGAAQANKSIFVSDVGFYLDPNKTGLAPPYERPLYMDEQMGCVRYWRSGQYRSGVPSGSTCGVVTPLVPPMRTIPTATYTDLIGTASKMTIGGNNGYTPSGGAPVVGSSEAGFDLVSPITMPNTWWGCLLKLSARM
jgi:hypothetical protein